MVFKRMPPDEMELYKRCCEVLHEIYLDPNGIAGTAETPCPGCSNVPPIFALVHDGASMPEVASALNYLVSEKLGLVSDLPKAEESARLIIKARDRINRSIDRDPANGR